MRSMDQTGSGFVSYAEFKAALKKEAGAAARDDEEDDGEEGTYPSSRICFLCRRPKVLTRCTLCVCVWGFVC